VVLKKPSDFFERENKINVSESIKDVEYFDTFQSYKKNLEKFDAIDTINAISNFSGSLEDYNENIEKVNYLSQQLLGVEEEIKTLLTREDLDRAMMSQVLVVEEITMDIQSRVKAINNEKLVSIKESVKELTEKVDEFISVDVPKYKGFVIDSEKRSYSRYDKFEGRISESIETVQQSIDDVRSSVDEKYEEIDENISEFQNKLTNKVSSVKKTVSEFIDEEKANISKNEIKVRQELENFENKLKEISVDVFESSEDNKNFKSDLIERVDNFLKNSNSTVDEKVEGIKNLKEELLQKVGSLEVDIVRNESHHSKSLDEIRLEIEKLGGLTENLSELTEKIEGIKEGVEDTEEEISKKIDSLEVDLIRNESLIKVQNESLDKIQVDVREAIEKLKVNELEEKNASLARKVDYIQEVLEKFSEKEVLTESITEPPTTNNSDPLTPTDQNFVTFDQLQGHYRLFLNRIQQQLSTLGGGGEVRLEFLDDVDRNSAKVNGKFLKYDSSVGKWVGANASGGAGSQTLDETLELGNTSSTGMSVGVLTASSFVKSGGTSSQFLKADGSVDTSTYLTSYTETQTLDDVLGLGNTSSTGLSVGVVTTTELHVGVDTGFFTEDLVVNGDARITGILSVGTETITLDPDANTVRIGTGITLNANTNSIEVGGSKIADTSGNAEYSGIVTASSFVGDVTGTATTATNLNNQAASYYLDYNNFVGVATDADKLDGQQGTYYLDYNNFTNTPTIPTNNNELTNGAGYITTSFTNTNQLTNGAGFITSSDTVALAEGLTGTPNLSVGVVTATSFDGDLIGTATTATNLNNQAASYYLDYDNFTNTPTIPTNNNELTNGAGYITTSFTNTNQLTNGAGFITSSDDITGTSGGLTGSPSITVTDITAVGNVSIAGTLTYEDVTNVDSIGIATARTGLNVLSGGINVTGVSTFQSNVNLGDIDVTGHTETDTLNVSGISTFTNKAEVRSDDGSQGRIDFYCEVSNAHYTRIQAAAHADYSGNAVVTLPSSTGTLLLTDGDGSGLSGIVTNIQAGANITVLESPTGNFIVTSTASGGDTVTINATATDILSVSSGDISADDAGADKLVFWDDSESKLTYLTAGNGLSIDGTTITATGSGGISGIEIENSGTSVGTGITAINFSTNVTATASGGIATVTASGGGGSVDLLEVMLFT
jgi:hypothetical protein